MSEPQRPLKPLVENEQSAALSSAEVVKGHEAAWGGEGNLYPIRPYTLTSASLEAFTVRERIHVRVEGLGEDIVDLHGMAVYRRHDPKAADGQPLTWANSTITAQFLALQVTGHSEVFGQVRVSNSPGKAEGARVKPSPPPEDHGIQPIKDCITMLYPRFEVEELGTTIDTGSKIVRLESRVAMVPPIGDVSRTSQSYTLFDPEGRQVGELIAADIEIGSLIHHVPIQSAVIPADLAEVLA